MELYQLYISLNMRAYDLTCVVTICPNNGAKQSDKLQIKHINVITRVYANTIYVILMPSSIYDFGLYRYMQLLLYLYLLLLLYLYLT